MSRYWGATEEPGWSLHLAPLKENIQVLSHRPSVICVLTLRQLVLDIGTGIGTVAGLVT